MKSAILIESNKPLIIADIELPEKLEFGQVQVNFQEQLHVAGRDLLYQQGLHLHYIQINIR